MKGFRPIVFWAYMLSLQIWVTADCIITKQPEIYTERYDQCDYERYYECRRLTRTVKKGPIVYSCSHTNITEVNFQVQSDIENIIFVQETSINSLEPTGYSWKNVTQLHMSNTATKKIVPGFFNKFDELQSLEITNNEIEVITDGVFSSLASLTLLNMSGNSIKSITEHSFSGLLNLKMLDLSKNKLSFISPNIFKYQLFLQYVDVSQNFLMDVGDTFELPLAQTINLSKNKLTAFDFGPLRSNEVLTMVDLSENRIENITGLNYICIETLSLAFNSIGALEGPDCITNLNVSNNKLKIMYDIKLESSLEMFDISYNQISDLTAGSFRNATNLKYLYLGHNNIHVLPSDIFVNQNKLEKLSISHNNLEKIPFGLFNSLRNLTVLDISDNNMVVNTDTLIPLTHLEELHFKNNNVTKFDPQVLLTRFKDLRYISLSDNSLNCSELAHTIHLLQVNDITFSKGSNMKTSNIFGITCRDNVESKEKVIQLKVAEQNPSTEIYNKNQNLVNNNSSQINTLNSINKTLTDLSRSLNALLKAQNADLSKTFLDLSDNLSSILKTQNNNFSLFLVDLKSIMSLKLISSENNSKLMPVITKNTNYNNESLIICNVLLLLILFCLLYLLYCYGKKRKYYGIRQEQIQLV